VWYIWRRASIKAVFQGILKRFAVFKDNTTSPDAYCDCLQTSVSFLFRADVYSYYICLYTVRPKSFRTDYFLKIEYTYLFFGLTMSSTDIYTCFCAVVLFLKSCRKFLFLDLFLIHRIPPLVSQQHPQTGVLLTSFSTWGTENSLVEINLLSTGCDKGL